MSNNVTEKEPKGEEVVGVVEEEVEAKVEDEEKGRRRKRNEMK